MAKVIEYGCCDAHFPFDASGINAYPTSSVDIVLLAAFFRLGSHPDCSPPVDDPWPRVLLKLTPNPVGMTNLSNSHVHAFFFFNHRSIFQGPLSHNLTCRMWLGVYCKDLIVKYELVIIYKEHLKSRFICGISLPDIFVFHGFHHCHSQSSTQEMLTKIVSKSARIHVVWSWDQVETLTYLKYTRFNQLCVKS